MGLWKKWMVYPNTCVSSSLCKVRFLTECQWPYIGASLACQWSGVGCWRDGTRMWCELLWRLPPPMLCDHWCCLVCPDIASWSLGTGSPQNLGLTKYFGCFMGNYEFTSKVIMSDEAGSWIPYCVSVSPQIKHYVGNSTSLNSQGRKLIIVSNKLSFTLVPSSSSFFIHANPSWCY